LRLNEEIEPYDKTLNKMGSNEKKEWANYVLNQMRKSTDIKNDEFIFCYLKRYSHPQVKN